MKIDTDTMNRLRDAYQLLDDICTRHPDCDCDECPLNRPIHNRAGRLVIRACVESIVREAVAAAELKYKGDST